MSKQHITILDGAMGTRLQALGLPLGGVPEVWNVTEPEKVTQVHREYVEAGAEIVYTNTFGANRYKLRNTGYSVEELVRAAVAAAKNSGAKRVALDIGPIGKLLSPLGDLSFEEAYDIFAEQVRAGSEADLIVIETMTDLYEAKAALLAAKEQSDKPVYVTMSFEKNGRTFTGTCIESMAMTLEGLGADGIGFNCSLGPKELAPMVKKLYTLTSLPIVLKANAGLPDPITNTYDVTPAEYAECIRELLPYGIELVGGCCGTSPEYLKVLAETVRSYEEACPENGQEADGQETNGREEACSTATAQKAPRGAKPTGVCSANRAVFFGVPRVIGERINPTGKKRLKEALLNKELDYILKQAISQVEAGAEILDVNVGLPGVDEKEMMVRVIRELQAVVDVPLQIDSNDPEVIEAALRIYNGKPLVNSVNGEEKSLTAILPLVKKYGAAVVGLTLDEEGIQASAEKRFAIAERIVERAEALGIPREDVQIDCLTLTASAEQAAVAETLRAVEMVRDRLGLGAVLGVSNVSFGLPNRELLNSTFLTMALHSGLTLPIMNPNAEAMMGAVRAYRLLKNIDQNALEYMEAYKNYVAPVAVAAPGRNTATGNNATGTAPGSDAVSNAAGTISGSTAPTDRASGDEVEATLRATYGEEAASLYLAVTNGLVAEGERSVEHLLQTMEPMGVINEVLIPALDKVGDGFEKGRLFLPQLILSASVVQAASAIIKAELAKGTEATISKGTIVLATVKGDIHDIGKNIVKVLLENYGYTVMDLGRDVEPSAVVEAVRTSGAPLVGLSALMTTTLGSMEATIRALKEAGLPCKVVVGGAVLTPEYAKTIGADYYSKDAKEAVDVARVVFGVAE